MEETAKGRNGAKQEISATLKTAYLSASISGPVSSHFPDVKGTFLSDPSGVTPGVTVASPQTVPAGTEASLQWHLQSPTGSPPGSLHTPHSHRTPHWLMAQGHKSSSSWCFQGGRLNKGTPWLLYSHNLCAQIIWGPSAEPSAPAVWKFGGLALTGHTEGINLRLWKAGS